MQITEVMAAINQMQDAGVIERYAIGGAVGAIFYLEPKMISPCLLSSQES